MATSVGSLTIEMAANIARLQKDMDSAKRTVDGAMSGIRKSVDGAIKALGALGAGLSITALAGFVKNAINLGDAMSDISQRTGVAVKDIAGLQMAFKYGGASAGAFESAMSRLSKGIVDGNLALKAMQIQTQNADGSMKSTRQILGEVADRFASYEDGARKTALAIELFGKSGAELLPVLNGGSEGLAKFDEMARKLGLTLDTQTVEKMGEFNDTLGLIKDASTGFFTQIAVQLLPALQSMAQAFFDLAQNGELVKFFADAIKIAFQTVAVVGSDVAFVVVQIGKAFVALKDAAGEALSGNFAAAAKVFEDYNTQAREARASLDKFQATVMGTGETTVSTMAKMTGAMKGAAVSAKELEEAQKKALEESAAAAKRNNEEFDKYFDTLEKVRLAEENGIKKAREMVEQIEFEAEALKMTNEEREVAIKLRQLELNGLEKGSAAYEEMANRIREAMVGKQAIQKAVDEQKKLEDEWKKTSENIEKSLTDALMRAFEDGKGFAQSFKDTLINMFKTMVLRPIIQAIVQPVGGAVLGALGMTAAGTAQASTGGGLSGATGILGGINLASSAFGAGAAASFNSIMAAGVSGWATAAGSLIGTGTLSGIAAGAGMIAAPILAAAGVLSAVFGSRTSVSQAIVGSLSTGGADLMQRTTTTKSGLLGSSTSVKLRELDFETQKFFDNAVQSITNAAKGYSDALGLLATEMDSISYAVKIKIGKNQEKNKAAIEAALTSFSEELAMQVMGSFETVVLKRNRRGEVTKSTTQWVANEFVREGETAFQALERLGTSLQAVNQSFDLLGLTLMEASLAGGDMASKLVDLLGGIEGFNAATGFYYENFYTEAERVANTTRLLTESMGALGFQLPQTRDAFRALIEAQDLTTESGRQTYAALMSLAPAFASITDIAIGAVSSLDSVYADAKKQTDLAFQAFQRSIDAQRQSALLAEQIASEQVSSLTEFLSMIRQQVNSIYGGSSAVSGMLASQGREFIRRAVEMVAQTGYLPDTDDLSKAVIDVERSIQEGNYDSFFEMEKDRRILAAQLLELEKAGENQLTQAEQQLLAAQQQIERLDQMLLNAQAQINELRNINTSVLGVQQAMSELSAAIRAETAAKAAIAAQQAAAAAAAARAAATNPNVGQVPSNAAPGVESAYQHRSGVNVLPSDSAIVAAAKIVYQSATGGVSTEQFNNAQAAVGGDIYSATGWGGDPAAFRAKWGFAAGGLHDGGMRLVGENGPEVEVTGPARYWTMGQLTGADSSNEIKKLREENRAQTRAMVQLQARMTRLLEKWDGDGIPEERSVSV
jgi:TolA-binding protein